MMMDSVQPESPSRRSFFKKLTTLANSDSRAPVHRGSATFTNGRTFLGRLSTLDRLPEVVFDSKKPAASVRSPPLSAAIPSLKKSTSLKILVPARRSASPQSPQITGSFDEQSCQQQQQKEPPAVTETRMTTGERPADDHTPIRPPRRKTKSKQHLLRHQNSAQSITSNNSRSEACETNLGDDRREIEGADWTNNEIDSAMSSPVNSINFAIHRQNSSALEGQEHRPSSKPPSAGRSQSDKTLVTCHILPIMTSPKLISGNFLVGGENEGSNLTAKPTGDAFPVSDDANVDLTTNPTAPLRASILKKKLRTQSNATQMPSTEDISSNDKRSSLRRPMKFRQLYPRKSTNFGGDLRTAAGPRRRVLFRSNVFVYQFDADQDSSSHLCDSSDDHDQTQCTATGCGPSVLVSRLKTSSDAYYATDRRRILEESASKQQTSSTSPDSSVDSANRNYRTSSFPLPWTVSAVQSRPTNNNFVSRLTSSPNGQVGRGELADESTATRSAAAATRSDRLATISDRNPFGAFDQSVDPSDWVSMRGSNDETLYLVTSMDPVEGGSLRITTRSVGNVYDTISEFNPIDHVSVVKPSRTMTSGYDKTTIPSYVTLPRTGKSWSASVTATRMEATLSDASSQKQFEDTLLLSDLNGSSDCPRDGCGLGLRISGSASEVQQNGMLIDGESKKPGAQASTRRLLISFKLPFNAANGGRPYDPETLLVKANREGNRVRIVSSPVLGTSPGHEFSTRGPPHALLDERFRLPYIVDPYRVMARLEPDSTLVIEAPIVG